MEAAQIRPVGPWGPAGRARALALTVAIALATAGAIGVVARAHRTVAASEPTVVGQGIPALQARLRSVPKDWRAWAALGSAYVQQARITGDPTYYPRAQQALERALTLDTAHDGMAMVGMGALAAARHDFAGALMWGKRARAVDPYNASVYGVSGDGSIELGRYAEGFAAIQRMVDLRPDVSSYARASYAWELRGNIPAATHAMELALQAASTPSDGAFADYYLGELAFNAGHISRALAFYEEAVARDPSSSAGLQGIAKVEAARGQLDRAIRDYTIVVERLPLPQYVIELADVYARAGNTGGAAQQIALLHLQERLFRANGVNIDLEVALFDADHHVDVEAGLHAARAEWSRRKSVFVADALAWSLYANGRYREALGYAERALHLGTRNASFWFHRGMIERALGMRADARRDIARALTINPSFSTLWSARAHTYLTELR